MISLRTETFRRYADRALEGRTGLGRLIGGIVIVLLCWGIATFGMIFLGMAALFAISQMGGEAFDFSDAGVLMARFAATPVGLISLLLSLGGLWIGVWIALRLLHKRKVATMLSISGRLDWSDFLRAFAVFATLPFLLQLASLPFEEAVVRNPIPLSSWLLAALAMVPALLIQTSAEEAFFRGYLPQNLAARFASPFVWALLPALAFSALHWRREIPAELGLAMFGGILVFAFVLLALLSRTGSLAASMGAHFGNNLVAILFVSHDDLFAGAAFFNGQTLQDMAGGWGQAASQFIASAGMILVGYLLLTHRRSPLALSATVQSSSQDNSIMNSGESFRNFQINNGDEMEYKSNNNRDAVQNDGDDEFNNAIEFFNLNFNCTKEDLESAFKKRSLDMHPDRWGGVPNNIKAQLEEEQKKINISREIILRYRGWK